MPLHLLHICVTMQEIEDIEAIEFAPPHELEQRLNREHEKLDGVQKLRRALLSQDPINQQQLENTEKEISHIQDTIRAIEENLRADSESWSDESGQNMVSEQEKTHRTLQPTKHDLKPQSFTENLGEITQNTSSSLDASGNVGSSSSLNWSGSGTNPALGTCPERDDKAYSYLSQLLSRALAFVEDGATEQVREIADFAKAVIEEREDLREKLLRAEHSARAEKDRADLAADAENRELMSLLEALTAEKEDLEKQLAKIKHDAFRLQNHLRDDPDSHLSLTCDDIESIYILTSEARQERRNLLASLEELRSQLAFKEKEISNLRESTHDQEIQVTSIKNELKIYQQKCKEISAELSETRDRLEQSRQSAVTILNEKNEAEQQIHSLEEIISNLHKEEKDTQQQVRSLQVELSQTREHLLKEETDFASSLKQEKTQLEEQLLASRHQCDSLQSELDRTKSQYENTERSAKDAQARSQQLQDELNSYTQRFQELQDEYDRILQDQENQAHILADVISEREKWECEAKDRSLTCEQADQERSRLQDRVRELEFELTKSRRIIDEDTSSSGVHTVQDSDRRSGSHSRSRASSQHSGGANQALPQLPEPLATNHRNWVLGMQRIMSQDKLRVKDLFDRLDSQGKGLLRLTDFEQSLKLIDMSISDHELRQLFNHLDHNKDSYINSDEFKRDIKYKYSKSKHDYHGPEANTQGALRFLEPYLGSIDTSDDFYVDLSQLTTVEQYRNALETALEKMRQLEFQRQQVIHRNVDDRAFGTDDRNLENIDFIDNHSSSEFQQQNMEQLQTKNRNQQTEIQRLQHEVRKLLQQLDDKEADRLNIDTAMKNLNESVNQSSSSINDLKMENNRLVRELNEARAEINRLEQDRRQLEIQNKDLRQSIADLEQDVKLFGDDVKRRDLRDAQAAAELQESRDELASKQELISTLEKQLIDTESNLNAELNKARTSLTALEQDKKRLQEQFVQAQNESSSLSERLVRQEKKCAELERQAEDIADQFRAASQRAEESQGTQAHYDEEMSRLNTDFTKVTNDLNAAHTRLNTELQNVVRLQTENDGFVRQIQDKQREIGQYEQEVRHLYDERTQLMAKFEVQRSQIDGLELDKISHQESMDAKNRELEALRAQVAEITAKAGAEADRYEAQMKGIIREKNQALAEYDLCRKQHEEVSARYSALQTQYDDIQSELDSVKSNLNESYEKQIIMEKNLQETEAQLKDALGVLYQANSITEQQLNKYTAGFLQHHSHNREHTSLLETIDRLNQEYEKERQRVLHELDIVKSQLQEQKCEAETVSHDRQQLENRLAISIEEREQLKVKLEASQNQAYRLNEELSEKKTVGYQDTLEQLNSLKEKCMSLQRELDDSEKSCAQQQALFSNKEAVFKKQIEGFRFEAKQWQDRLEASERKLQQVNAELTTAQNEIVQLQQTIRQAEATEQTDRTVILSQLQRVEAEQKENQAQLSQITQQRDNLQRQFEDTMSNLKDCMLELEKAKLEVSRLENELQESQHMSSQREKRIQELDSHLVHVQSEVVTLTADLSQKNTYIEDLQIAIKDHHRGAHSSVGRQSISSVSTMLSLQPGVDQGTPSSTPSESRFVSSAGSHTSAQQLQSPPTLVHTQRRHSGGSSEQSKSGLHQHKQQSITNRDNHAHTLDQQLNAPFVYSLNQNENEGVSYGDRNLQTQLTTQNAFGNALEAYQDPRTSSNREAQAEHIKGLQQELKTCNHALEEAKSEIKSLNEKVASSTENHRFYRSQLDDRIMELKNQLQMQKDEYVRHITATDEQHKSQVEALREQLSQQMERYEEACKGLKFRISADGKEISSLKERLDAAQNALNELTSQELRTLQHIRPFVANYDYNPNSLDDGFDRSMELSLERGEFVYVIGRADLDGFFEGISGGRRGLVPSTYIKELRLHQNQLLDLINTKRSSLFNFSEQDEGEQYGDRLESLEEEQSKDELPQNLTGSRTSQQIESDDLESQVTQHRQSQELVEISQHLSQERHEKTLLEERIAKLTDEITLLDCENSKLQEDVKTLSSKSTKSFSTADSGLNNDSIDAARTTIVQLEASLSSERKLSSQYGQQLLLQQQQLQSQAQRVNELEQERTVVAQQHEGCRKDMQEMAKAIQNYETDLKNRQIELESSRLQVTKLEEEIIWMRRNMQEQLEARDNKLKASDEMIELLSKSYTENLAREDKESDNKQQASQIKTHKTRIRELESMLAAANNRNSYLEGLLANAHDDQQRLTAEMLQLESRYALEDLSDSTAHSYNERREHLAESQIVHSFTQTDEYTGDNRFAANNSHEPGNKIKLDSTREIDKISNLDQIERADENNVVHDQYSNNDLRSTLIGQQRPTLSQMSEAGSTSIHLSPRSDSPVSNHLIIENNKQIQELVIEIRQLEELLQQRDIQVSSLEQDVQQLQKELTDARGQLASERRNSATIQCEFNQSQKIQNQRLQGEVNKLRQECSELQAKIAEFEATVQQLEQESNAYRREYATILQQRNSTRALIVSLSTMMQETAGHVYRLNENLDVRSSTAEINSRVFDLQSSMQRLEGLYARGIKLANQEHDELFVRVQHLEQNEEDMQNRLRSLNERAVTAECALEEERKNLYALEQSKQASDNNYSQATKDVQSQREELARTQQDLKRLEQELQEAKTQLAQERTDLNEKLVSSQQTQQQIHSTLEEQNRKLELTIQQMSTENIQSKQLADEAHNKVKESLEKEIAGLKLTLKDTMEQKMQLQNRLSQYLATARATLAGPNSSMPFNASQHSLDADDDDDPDLQEVNEQTDVSNRSERMDAVSNQIHNLSDHDNDGGITNSEANVIQAGKYQQARTKALTRLFEQESINRAESLLLDDSQDENILEGCTTSVFFLKLILFFLGFSFPQIFIFIIILSCNCYHHLLPQVYQAQVFPMSCKKF